MSKGGLRRVKPDEVQAGDLAYHVTGLDPREVVYVEGDLVFLDILGAVCGPFPKSNYAFKRWVD